MAPVLTRSGPCAWTPRWASPKIPLQLGQGLGSPDGFEGYVVAQLLEFSDVEAELAVVVDAGVVVSRRPTNGRPNQDQDATASTGDLTPYSTRNGSRASGRGD